MREAGAVGRTHGNIVGQPARELQIGRTEPLHRARQVEAARHAIRTADGSEAADLAAKRGGADARFIGEEGVCADAVCRHDIRGTK